MQKWCDHFVPYCTQHMKYGDPSIIVDDHPKYIIANNFLRFGKLLATRRDLPKNYRTALFGDIMCAEEMPDDDKVLFTLLL